MQISTGKMIHYVQKSLFEGKKDVDGCYIYEKAELAEGAHISESTVNRYKDELVKYLGTLFDLCYWAKYQEYKGAQLFIEVKYTRGKLSFRRNPITFEGELSKLWALPPLWDWFCYDYFDDQHRRRTNGEAKYDAIPW